MSRAVQAALDVHVAKGTMEKFESGRYGLVPRERLTPEQSAWLDMREVLEEHGSIDDADPEVLRELMKA